jgi:motility quorum-sensing regulator/GCU-specific mRNA interferase toxin
VEKRKPSHDLRRVKAVCGDPERLRMTFSATVSAEGLGYKPADVARLIRSMERPMFYKSMTSYGRSDQWQDVYHVPGDEGLTIYVKFTADVVTEFLVLSFKER